MAENALGTFLRARREATAPAEPGPRRTPGLRRSELAELASISVEYLTRLERGSDRRPSGQVLGALADALRLAPDERVHLHRLAKIADGAVCTQSTPPEREVRPTVRALLDQLELAFVADAQGDLLAWSDGFGELAAAIGLLDAEYPNLARFVFTDPRAHTAFPEWDRVADTHAAALRAAADLADHHAAALAEELSITAGAEFSRRYAAAGVLPSWTGDELWGELRLAYENLALPGTEDQRLVIYLPTQANTPWERSLPRRGTATRFPGAP
ncbi:helix-turn-helix transcriptional regulator [Allokutzneria sp. A3M-2-11 16]|uniref:helix-turn-helix transcriptional regulator n=1 Tax=Allokutzneria sp. A3M-2-11 16 TaxID=2962043 RepID=UPI0020B7AA79|nr:helix-turn-helix transcriptional regulator [Allokutzneria sp. A3M-2-11 16]MCP3804182.1 helix-turn-helix transcriptional regulator [Allokutzneria sp. A3M-2-11 16]